MEWYWIVLIVLGSLLVFLFLVVLLIAYFVYRMIAHPHRYSREEQISYNGKMGWDDGVEVFKRTPIEFSMSDGYLIHGDYDLIPGSKGFCLLAHGHQTSREGARRYALIFRELGYSTIVYDERGHGDNVHGTVTMGYKESHDLAEIIDQVYKKFGSGIVLGLQGVSMGAFTVLLSTRYCQKEAFIVSDCAFYDLKDVINKQLHARHLPAGVLLPFIDFDLRHFAGFSFADATLNGVIAANEVPVLFIHGEEDRYVPVSHAHRIYKEDGGEKELVLFPVAGHASSITVDRQKYKDAVASFIKKLED